MAFVAVLVAGACGGFIGYGITDLQCDGDCTTPNGLGLLAGALLGAGGAAVVAVLVLRAMDEWRTIQARPGRQIHPAPGAQGGQGGPPPG
jgi:hypothetical protein